MSANPQATALFLGSFLDELMRWGVRDVVVSPGSRSTPLSMTAFELSQRFPQRLRVLVDVDERGAAFVALGMAKATGRPVAVVCTSGTAVANYYPAVMEAESSRVPLLVLTGDRPPRLQGLGAPQTCDQLNAYGNHVRRFQQMPLPADDAASLAFARQMAREACIAAGGEDAAVACQQDEPRLAGYCEGGPVHFNFPFDEPLKPDFSVLDAVLSAQSLPQAAALRPGATLDRAQHELVMRALGAGGVVVLAGEGSCATEQEARDLLAWAQANSLPLLADPLSGLRSFDHPLIIDNYDTLCAQPVDQGLAPRALIRFGRYPVSKRATQFFQGIAPLTQVVVDTHETRDFNLATSLFVRMAPHDFISCMGKGAAQPATGGQQAFANAWRQANDAARQRILAAADAAQLATQAVADAEVLPADEPATLGRDAATQPAQPVRPDQPAADLAFEGLYVRALLQLIPDGSCLFAANSMSVRALDTFCLKGEKRLSILCNRGLNGIDGTVSSVIGAAQSFTHTTLLTGDLTLQHDLNALALQREWRLRQQATGAQRNLVIVLLNNNGGAIFDMLPQKSDEAYFQRLFLTPQDVDFQAAARAFGVLSWQVDSVAAFQQAYTQALDAPGISLVEVTVPLEGLKERYAPFWRMDG